MLFKTNDRSFKFFLMDLCESEEAEMSNLITDNGGEICTEGLPPVIIFCNFKSYYGNEPVFHINYIRECVKHHQLLDLINFKIGAKGYYGCIMSMFVYGENMCSFVEDTGSCCSSRSVQNKKLLLPVNDDHIYAQGDVTIVETSNAVSWSALDSTPQDSELLSHRSSPDSVYLLDRSPPNPGYPPDRVPGGSECLPARALRDSEFVPAGSPPDSDFLPDELPQNPGLLPGGNPQNSELLPAGLPRDSKFLPAGLSPDPELVAAGSLPDSKFLPVGSPPNPRFPPDGATQNSELLLAGSPQDREFVAAKSPSDSEFLPDGPPQNSKFRSEEASQNSELRPAGSPPDSEFLPDGSPQDPVPLPAGSPPDSEFLPDESPQDPVLPPAGSPPDSEFLPDRSSQDSDFLLAGSPRDSEFLPDESPQSPESLRDGSPRDSEFLPEESQSPINAVVFDCTEERFPRGSDIDSALKIPEPARFEKLFFGADQSLSKDLTFCGNSPAASSDDITIVHMQLGDKKDAKIITKSAYPRLSVNELYPLSAAEEEAVACEDLPVSIEQDDEVSLNARLKRLRTSEPKTTDRAMSPIFESRKMKRKSPPKKTHVDELPVAGGSKTAASPTILRDESNQVKVLGGIKASLNNIEQFRLTSSDSDNTDYNPTTTVFDRERRESVDQNSFSGVREVDTKKKVLKKHREIRNPLRESDISEDEEQPEVLNNDEKTVRQSNSKKKLDYNSRTSNTPVNISRVTNDERNTVVSSTRSSDDVISISNSDSDPMSDDGVASSSSNRITSSANSPKESKMPNAVSEKVKRSHPLRNYLPWEQREMVKYLIDKGLISEAKGNRVWKQMIEDGYLSHRTVLSLNNHFRKFILPHIHRFPMESESLRKFRKLLE